MKVEEWTGDETISIKEILAVMNEITEIDPDLMSHIGLVRFPCNHGIRDHETVQAHCYGDASLKEPKAGFIGVLNGILGIDKNRFGPITINISEVDGSVTGFRLTDTKAMTPETE